MFPGETIPQVKSPLDKNVHPELDNSEIANEDLIAKFMCVIANYNGLLPLVDMIFYLMLCPCHASGVLLK